MSLIRASYWIDAAGKTRLITQEANATLTAIDLAKQALSNAQIYRDFEGTRVNSVAVPVNATFASVNDVARLTYADAGGNLVNILIPSPLQSLFLADNETVDITQLGTINLAVIGTVLTPSGGVVTAYVAGSRSPSSRELI